MVDNTIALQVRPFQMPDVGQIYGQAQNIQMNRMRMAEAQETAQERNALRGLLSSGVDLNTPEGMAQLRRAAPMLAPQFEQAASQRAYQRAQISRIESQNDREALQTAQTLLSSVRGAEDYAALRPALLARFPQYAQFFRPEYSPELVRSLALGAQSLATQVVQPGGSIYDPTTNTARFTAPAAPQRPVVGQGPGNIPTITDPVSGTFRLAKEEPAGQPTTPARQPTAPAAGARVPTSQSDDPLAIDSAIRRAEGTGQNPRSSAQGQYQFLDGTFVEQFRRAFPDAAQGRSDAEVLRFRGAALPDGRRVEDVLGPAFTQQNMQALTRAGVSPTGGNVYLAHHFGAQGALNLLRADPNTPIERVVSRQVLDANPFLRGSSVGQVAQWANNAVDYGPGEAQRLLVAARQPSPEPGAPGPVNLMAPAPAGANAMRPPTTVSEALEQTMLRQLRQRRGEQAVAREDQPGRVAEAGQTAGAQAQAQADVRAAEDERKRQRGRESIESVLGDMVTSYRRLDELGGIPSERRSGLANVPAYLAGTAPGQEVGKALATQSQTQRNQIQASVRQLLTAIKNATGMSAQEMNSNVELQQLLAAVSSPTQSIESVRGILSSISRQYGLGQLDFPEPAAAPTAAPREPTPGPRRGAAPAPGTTPTLEQFLAAARRANPNVSDQALTDYYNRTYGGR